jgi:hypothetical protein
MRARSITAVVAALALLHAAPARAAGPTPPTHASAGVAAVYADFAADNQLAGCDHTLADLQATRSTMTPAVADDFPAFADQVRKAVHDHQAKQCPNDRVRAPTPTPTPTATPTSTPESGQLPPGATGGGGGGAVPPAPAITPTATATAVPTTVPTAAPPAAAVPTPTPAVVTHTAHHSVTLPLLLIALAVLGAGGLAASAVAGRRSPGVRHAWREAALRTRGTWADFSDWLRLGR